MLRFSFIIPTYNRRHTIANAVRSVAEQSAGKEIEFVIVDDSTDDTLDVARAALRPYPGCTLLTHRGETRLRAAGAKNHGISMATGDVCVFLDSDDELLPGALDYMSRFFPSHPEVDVLFGSIRTKSGDPPRREERFLDRIVEYEELVAHEKAGEFLPVVRRRVLVQSDLRFSADLIGFEGLLWYGLARSRYRFFFTSTPLRLYDDLGTDRTTNAGFRADRAGQFAVGHVRLLQEFGADIRARSKRTYRRRLAKAMLYNRLAQDRDPNTDAFLREASPVTHVALEWTPTALLRRLFALGVRIYGDT